MSTELPASPPFAQAGRPPRNALVVVTRRIGDVLLATPLIRSIKRAWPAAAVDVLVFEGTDGVIAANPDIRNIIIVPQRPAFALHLLLLARLWRRYDIALSLVPGDRPTFYAFIAGRWRAGLLLDTPKERWKRSFLHRWVPFDDLNTHTVLMHLSLADAIGIARSRDIVATWPSEDEKQLDTLLGPDRSQPLAVLHTYPKFNYKMWHQQGWIEVARWLAARGWRLVLSGGGDAAELAYVAALARLMPPATLNLAGKLSLTGAACLLSRARLYVGPDTALTHMAAALGVPTIALYGPSNPAKWGPWPRGHAPDTNPWRLCGSQRAGNVVLVQGTESCVPCRLEGCGRNIESFSDCLQNLPAIRVIAAAETLLGS